MAARGALPTKLAKWSQHTRALPPLRIGDRVRIQNQTGPAPHRWEKSQKKSNMTSIGLAQDERHYRIANSYVSSLPLTQTTTDTQPPLVPPPDLRPSSIEPDTDPTLWDSLPRESPPTPRQIPLDTHPDQPPPTTDKPSTPAPAAINMGMRNQPSAELQD